MEKQLSMRQTDTFIHVMSGDVTFDIGKNVLVMDII